MELISYIIQKSNISPLESAATAVEIGLSELCREIEIDMKEIERIKMNEGGINENVIGGNIMRENLIVSDMNDNINDNIGNNYINDNVNDNINCYINDNVIGGNNISNNNIGTNISNNNIGKKL